MRIILILSQPNSVFIFLNIQTVDAIKLYCMPKGVCRRLISSSDFTLTYFFIIPVYKVSVGGSFLPVISPIASLNCFDVCLVVGLWTDLIGSLRFDSSSFSVGRPFYNVISCKMLRGNFVSQLTEFFMNLLINSFFFFEFGE